MHIDVPRVFRGGTGSLKVEKTHRTMTASETLERVRPLLRAVGVTRIANITGMDVIGIPTVMVTRPNARSLSVSQGKGVDLESAKVSAVMESLEQWHAERIDRPVRFASSVDLDTASRVVNVTRLPSIAPGGLYDGVTPILWIGGMEVSDGEPILVPYEMVHLDLRVPFPPGSGWFLKGSNGLASGNCLAEAVAHGIFEVVERDANTLFYLLPWEGQWERRVDLSTVRDPVCLALLKAFDQALVDVAVWETTSDVGISCYLCSIVDREENPFRPVGLSRGSGCHLDRPVALSRALTEAAQSRLTRIVGTRDDIQQRDFTSLREDARLSDARKQVATPSRPPRTFEETPSASTVTAEGDVGRACAALRAAGMGQVITVDLSRAEFPVSVVRVIVPGLEASSDVPGYHPGKRARRVSAELET